MAEGRWVSSGYDLQVIKIHNYKIAYGKCIHSICNSKN